MGRVKKGARGGVKEARRLTLGICLDAKTRTELPKPTTRTCASGRGVGPVPDPSYCPGASSSSLPPPRPPCRMAKKKKVR